MVTPDSQPLEAHKEGGWFPSTHWSLVMNAGRDSTSEAREAFGKLYENYRAPLLTYLRWQGRNSEEAEELVQGFFEFLLAGRGLGKVQRKGRFRSWLLVCLKHYLADLGDKQRALKRGGNAPHLTLEGSEDEAAVEPPHPGRTPDEEYDRQFALRFIELAMARLEREYEARAKSALFEALHPFLLEKQGAVSHADLGRKLHLQENAVTQEIFRLRRRYRSVFDEELLQLVGSPQELEEEKRLFFAALRR